MFEAFLQPMHLLLMICIALLFIGPGKLKKLANKLGERSHRAHEPQHTADADIVKNSKS